MAVGAFAAAASLWGALAPVVRWHVAEHHRRPSSAVGSMGRVLQLHKACVRSPTRRGGSSRRTASWFLRLVLVMGTSSASETPSIFEQCRTACNDADTCCNGQDGSTSDPVSGCGVGSCRQACILINHPDSTCADLTGADVACDSATVKAGFCDITAL